MDFGPTRKVITTFSTISLADIILLLLIFFLLSSSFIVQPGIKVNLPKASPSQVESEKRIYLTITKSGDIYLNQEKIKEGELGVKLRGLLLESPGELVVIKADKDLTLQETIRIMDIAKNAGANRFLIATQSD